MKVKLEKKKKIIILFIFNFVIQLNYEKVKIRSFPDAFSFYCVFRVGEFMYSLELYI